MLGAGKTIAVQDPSYPVYVDTTVMLGNTGQHDGTGFEGIEYMLCTPENDFFPDLANAKRTDVIFFCSPNNPTGAAATRAQLKQLVDFAKKNGSLIVYDAAYALYIQNPDCPRTIFEIEGADEVAVETCSFSKYAGFTGVRLGWTVVPKKLRFSDGSSVHADWNRVMTTCFNGASNIVQAGGLACLQPEGLKEMHATVGFYKENAEILRKAFKEMGFSVYGASFGRDKKRKQPARVWGFFSRHAALRRLSRSRPARFPPKKKPTPKTNQKQQAASTPPTCGSASPAASPGTSSPRSSRSATSSPPLGRVSVLVARASCALPPLGRARTSTRPCGASRRSTGRSKEGSFLTGDLALGKRKK
jgi:hypothetical protein